RCCSRARASRTSPARAASTRPRRPTRTNMAAWIWEASTRAGEHRSGTMEADNELAVRDRLSAQGLVISSVKKKPVEIKLPTLGSGVSLKDLVVFTRTFSTMVDAGLPIV